MSGRRFYKKKYVLIVLMVISSDTAYSQVTDVIKIWDEAPHNAFTDLIRYKSFFYCTFREGIKHVPADTSENGKIRIIRSRDMQKWEPVALLASRKYDLRDPTLSVIPQATKERLLYISLK